MGVYVTGDTHGTKYLAKILPKNLEKYEKGDIIFITGDFGLIYRCANEELEEKYLRVLNESGLVFCFIDGDRENYDRLAKYPVTQWNGGKVHKIKENIYHLLRGEIYTVDDKKILCLGGASTVFKERTIEHRTWWKEENISEADINNALYNLKLRNMKVDYILTHTCPLNAGFMIQEDEIDALKLQDENCLKLEKIYENAEFKKWCFGHFHKDIELDDKFTCVFQSVIKI